MFTPIRTISVAASLAVGAAVAIPAFANDEPEPDAAAAKTQTLRFFSKPVSITLRTADGSVIRKPPYPEPKPGDVLDVNSLDYVGNHRRHAARWSMSDHVRCVFSTGEPDCEGQVAIGGSLLIFRGFPGTLTNATGRYQGATGRVLRNQEVPGGSDIVARVHLPARARNAIASAARRRATARTRHPNTAEPLWRHALRVRSEAMNQRYGAGR